MKDVLLLTKVLIKNSYSFSNIKKKDIFSYTIVYSFLLIYTCFFTYTMTNALASIGMESIVLNIILMATLCLILFQNTITAINLLFFSKDSEHILPLPITSGKYLISKINCLLFTEYLANLVYFLPALITYGVVLKLGFLYYVYSVLVFLIFPILPLIIVIFIMSLLMKFTKIIRNKDVAQYISVVISFALICLLFFILSNTSNNITTNELNSILLYANEICDKMAKVFITIRHSSNVLNNYSNIEGFIYLLKLLLETFVGFIVLFFIVHNYLIKIIMNVNSSAINTKSISANRNIYNRKPIWLSYLKKEFLCLSRNSVFSMQCLLPSVVMPLFIVMPIVIAVNKGGEEAADIISVFSVENPIYWLSFRLIMLQFLLGISFISITAISREGTDAFVMKYLPISYGKQIKYKAYVGIIMSLSPIIILTILDFYIEKTIILKELIMFLITGILSSIVFNYSLVLIDLKHPKLKWESEYAVIKQNINMAFGLFVATFMCVIVLLSVAFTNSILLYFLILCGFFLTFIMLIKIYIKRKTKLLFEKLEV